MLETELKRVLDRAAKREHEQPPATGTPPGWEPIFMARELNPNQRAANLREMPRKAPPPTAKVSGLDGKRSGMSARNILAISLSVGIIGIAVQQIGTQWSQARDGSETPAGETVDDTQLAYGVQPAAAAPQTVQLRTSATNERREARPSERNNRDGGGQGRDAFMQDVEQAATMLATPAKPRPQQRQASVPPVLAPEPKEPTLRDQNTDAISGAEEQSMLRRARELMERGHVSGARLLFEHLALRQSAIGAFALAQTYDEKFLKSLGVQGLAPDEKLAAKWYRRAAELGSQSAEKPRSK